MSLIISTLNSKFIHSSLATRYLRVMVEDMIDTELIEFTINQNNEYIAREIYKRNPKIIAFSVYIWNLEETLKICKILKIVKPELKIILGGPEVSFEFEELMEENPEIDFLIYGEGEITFKEFINNYINNKNYSEIKGLVYRKDEIKVNPPRELIEDLNIIPSPFDTERVKKELKNKIIYYESSRGCPFGCKFCLSSTIKKLRYFDIERVKKDLKLLIDAKVKQVKFVDRTFNADKDYALQLMEFIIEEDPKNINFHFEVTAELLDREMLDFLSEVKEGLFQFEIGVQSTNPKTLKAVGRNSNFEELKEITKEVKSFNNIHQHLDLIAGLPYEDYDSFKKSFNDVYEIRPEKIQLGFLKILKGTDLKREEDKYGFKYLNKPAYEIVETNWLNYSDIIKLKSVEDIIEKYSNGENFKHSIEFVIKNFFEDPFDFFEDMAKYWEEEQVYKIKHSKNALYTIFVDYYKNRNFNYFDIFNELLKLDFLVNNQPTNLAKGIKREKLNLKRDILHQILRRPELLNNQLNDYKDKTTKELVKNSHLERFKYNPLEIIENGYKITEKNERIIFIFYRKGVLNLAEKIDVTDLVRSIKDENN